MSQALNREPTDRFDAGAILASGYDELTRVDQALRDAERRLAAAHHRSGEQGVRQAQELYLEVMALRIQSRRVLAILGEIWVRDR
jgi:hypothetical protein